MAFVTLTFSMLNVLVPLLSVDLGAGPGTVGLLVSIGHVLPTLLAIQIGRWVDRVGSRPVLTVGAIGATLSPMVVVFAPDLTALVMIQLLSGLFHTCVAVGSQSLVASLGEPRQHDRNFAWYMTFLSIGQLAGPIAAGLAVDAFGYRVAFAALPIAGSAALLNIGLLHRLRLVDAGNRSLESVSTRTQLRHLSSNVGVQLAILGSCGILTAIAVRQAFIPAYLLGEGFSATAIGTLLSLRALAAVAVRPIMPRLVRLLGGRARALTVMIIIVSVAVGLLGTTTSYALLAMLSLLAGIGSGIGMPLSIVTIASHVEPHQRATALALRLTVNRGAQIVTPLLVGAMIAWLGYTVSFIFTGLGLLVVALQVVALTPKFEERELEH